MAKDLFNRYIWLVDTIYRADGITFEEINEKWLRSSMNDGEDLPLHHSQVEVKTEEEYSDFTYCIAPTYDFIQEILSHGYEVEVRSPSHLRGYIKWVAETMASKNG